MAHCFKSCNKREKNEIDFNFSERSNDSPKVNHGTVLYFFSIIIFPFSYFEISEELHTFVAD